VLKVKEAIISHLSWVSPLLGFHTLACYNDVVVVLNARKANPD